MVLLSNTPLVEEKKPNHHFQLHASWQVNVCAHHWIKLYSFTSHVDVVELELNLVDEVIPEPDDGSHLLQVHLCNASNVSVDKNFCISIILNSDANPSSTANLFCCYSFAPWVGLHQPFIHHLPTPKQWILL